MAVDNVGLKNKVFGDLKPQGHSTNIFCLDVNQSGPWLSSTNWRSHISWEQEMASTTPTKSHLT